MGDQIDAFKAALADKYVVDREVGVVATVRILFLADTHLGFDLPVRPRVARRRRGHDFFTNFERALDAAASRRVDLLVHGGDLFFRSRVPATVVHRAFMLLKRVAQAGIPVYLVPGNHERSRIPYSMLALHPGIHVFDRPRTFVARVNGITIALAGFPYWRKRVRREFSGLLQETGWRDAGAHISLLCVHHCFEGATVGPGNFVFRFADDVVRAADVPEGLAAVLSGHIHRHQVLTTDLGGRSLPAPVLYPGSVERTSFAEKDEPKGYLILEVRPGIDRGGVLEGWEFCRLPVRPMVMRDLQARAVGAATLESRIRDVVERVPADAVLRLRVHGVLDERARATLTAANLRSLAPPSMNVDVRLVMEREL